MNPQPPIGKRHPLRRDWRDTVADGPKAAAFGPVCADFYETAALNKGSMAPVPVWPTTLPTSLPRLNITRVARPLHIELTDDGIAAEPIPVDLHHGHRLVGRIAVDKRTHGASLCATGASPRGEEVEQHRLPALHELVESRPVVLDSPFTGQERSGHSERERRYGEKFTSFHGS